jgi:hypothetical protein
MPASPLSRSPIRCFPPTATLCLPARAPGPSARTNAGSWSPSRVAVSASYRKRIQQYLPACSSMDMQRTTHARSNLSSCVSEHSQPRRVDATARHEATCESSRPAAVSRAIFTPSVCSGAGLLLDNSGSPNVELVAEGKRLKASFSLKSGFYFVCPQV